MRATRRRRPLRRKLASNPDLNRLAQLAERVEYVGSPEHKDIPSFAGAPRPRADASICDRSLARRREQIEGWLRAALERGHVSELQDGEYPRYVWYRDAETDTVYEGRVVNRGLGQYKGYPLDRGEEPPDLVATEETPS